MDDDPLSEGNLSASVGYQGAHRAHSHGAQLHQQLWLDSFRPVRRCTTITSGSCLSLCRNKSTDGPSLRLLWQQQLWGVSQVSATPQLYGLQAVALPSRGGGGPMVTRSIFWKTAGRLETPACNGWSCIISNLDGPQLYNNAIFFFSPLHLTVGNSNII